MKFVELDVALSASGLRLVVLAGVPSPWSQAALTILRYKKLPFLCARSRAVDPSFRAGMVPEICRRCSWTISPCERAGRKS